MRERYPPIEPHAELVLVDDAGHGSSGAGMADALISATDRFRTIGTGRTP